MSLWLLQFGEAGYSHEFVPNQYRDRQQTMDSNRIVTFDRYVVELEKSR